MTITEKQKAFVDEYLIDLNATRAYKAVYKSCKKDDVAASAASRLLSNVKVSAYLAQRQKELQKRTEVTQDMVIEELRRIGFANMTDYTGVINGAVVVYDTDRLPDEKQAALAGIKQGKNGIEVKTHDKVRALELLGRHLGMFKGDNLDQDEIADDGFIEALEGKLEEVWDNEASGDIPL